MRTTLNIDEELLRQVMTLTGERSKAKAINLALSDYVQNRRIQELLEMPGKISLVDNLKELEEIEVRDFETVSVMIGIRGMNPLLGVHHPARADYLLEKRLRTAVVVFARGIADGGK